MGHYSFRCTAAFVLTLVTITHAQSQENKSTGGWLDHWRFSTFSFGVVEKDKNQRQFYRAIGTGLIITADTKTAHILTAKHVFEDAGKNWQPKEINIRFAWQEQQSVFEYLGSTLKLYDTAGKKLWVDDDKGADIAVLPIAISDMNIKAGIQPHAISVSDFSSKDDFFEGASVVVLGYPGIVGNDYLVRAMLRSGVIAWLDPNDPVGKPFLVDSNIYPGNSGGPVIRLPTGMMKDGSFNIGGKISLLGVVSKAPGVEQIVSLNVPGQSQPLELKQSLPLGGTGVIEPTIRVPSMLEKLRSR